MKFHHNHTTSGHSHRGDGADPRRPILPGIALLAAGVVFLLHNLGTIDASALIPYWPVFLIVAGFTYFFGRRGRETPIAGGVSSQEALE